MAKPMRLNFRISIPPMVSSLAKCANGWLIIDTFLHRPSAKRFTAVERCMRWFRLRITSVDFAIRFATWVERARFCPKGRQKAEDILIYPPHFERGENVLGIGRSRQNVEQFRKGSSKL